MTKTATSFTQRNGTMSSSIFVAEVDQAKANKPRSRRAGVVNCGAATGESRWLVSFAASGLGPENFSALVRHFDGSSVWNKTSAAGFEDTECKAHDDLHPDVADLLHCSSGTVRLVLFPDQ